MSMPPMTASRARPLWAYSGANASTAPETTAVTSGSTTRPSTVEIVTLAMARHMVPSMN